MLKLKHLLKPEGKLIVNTFSNSPNYEMEEELIGKFYKFQSEMKTTNRIMIVSELMLGKRRIHFTLGILSFLDLTLRSAFFIVSFSMLELTIFINAFLEASEMASFLDSVPAS